MPFPIELSGKFKDGKEFEIKLIKKIRWKEFEWTLIALSLSALASIIFRTAAMKQITTLGFVIHIGVVIVVFIGTLASGVAIERKIVRDFQNELKGGEKE